MYGYYDYELDARLHNSLSYYKQLAGTAPVSAFTPAFKPANRESVIELKAKAVHKAMWEDLEEQPAFTGNTLSRAKQQVRADIEALKAKRDRELGERAAIGRAKVLKENLAALLKQVKKLSPTQKARKDAGLKGDYYDGVFNCITLHFSMERVGVEMEVIDGSQHTRICLPERIGCTLYSATFSVTVNWRDLEELVALLDKGVVTLRMHDWTKRFALQQGRFTARIPATLS